MKDRKPKYPGRIMLTPVSGKNNVYDMVRADEPEDVGTPISKNTFLTDETAEKLGLDPAVNPTPNDALAALAYKAGDIKETVRTDLGDRWVLCNGDVVPEGELPALREVLPYNTEWRRLPPGSVGYSVIRPMPVPGQWLIMKEEVKATQIANNDTALLYDESTETFSTILCPFASGSSGIGIFGLTHDGEKYVLGTCSGSIAEASGFVARFYTSTDLKTWKKKLDYTLPYTPNGGTVATNLMYNGAEVVFATHYYNYVDTQNGESGEVYYLDAAMTTAKKYSGISYSSMVNLVLLPYPYWATQAKDAKKINVKKTGTSDYGFSFSDYGRIAFFSDNYWIGLPPADTGINARMRIAELASGEVSSFYISDMIGDRNISSNINMKSADYDPNAREWCFRFYYSSADRFWLAYISEDADPRVTSNYRVVEVSELPEVIGDFQMTPNRSEFRGTSQTERYIKNPNIKCVPTHDGDTLKYIYTG